MFMCINLCVCVLQIDIGDGKYLHVRIYCPLPGQGGPSVHNYQLDKTAEEPIDYFGWTSIDYRQCHSSQWDSSTHAHYYKNANYVI